MADTTDTSRPRLAKDDKLRFEGEIVSVVAIESENETLHERCPSCGHAPTPSDEQAREQAIERAVRPGEQVRAMEVLGRIGMGPAVSIDDVKARMVAQVRELRLWAKEEGLTSQKVEALLTRSDAVWR
jgi:hypothetical protein